MDFDLTHKVEQDILIVTFNGQSTGPNAHAMVQSYFDIVMRSGRKKVLADIRPLRGRLSGGETYFLVRDLPVKPPPVDIRTAVLESTANRAYGDFLETTAANAGVKLKHFIDEGEALAWLRAP